MALIDVPLNRLQLEDLQALVVEQAREGRSLELKQLVEGDDGAKREFLADVSSLANASGGDLVIGVREEDGIATELVGIPRADAETLRLENILRDGLQPRLPGVQTRIIDHDQERAVLVMRVPRSWAGPHMVAYKRLSRFYSRNSAGKYQLDVGEIRAAFNSSQTAQAAVRDFRIERLSRITADQGGVPLLAGAKVVMHLIPLSVTDGLVVGLCYSRRWKSSSWSRSTGCRHVRQRPSQQRSSGCRSATVCGSVRLAAGLLGRAVRASGRRARR
jgi:hypothetical protein